MAITKIGPFWCPAPPVFPNSAPALAGLLTQNAAAREIAYMLRIPKTGTLDHFEFYSSVSNAVDNGMHVSFRAIDPATNKPSTTIDQFRILTMGSVTTAWFTTGIISDDGTDTGVKRSVTVGDNMCVVIKFNSFVAGDLITPQGITSSTSGTPNTLLNFISTTLDTEATWGASIQTIPCMALAYSDGTYAYFGDIVPAAGVATDTYNTGSNPDEIGLRFQFPVDTEVNGAWLHADLDGDYTVCLYNAADGLVASFTSSAIERSLATAGNAFCPFVPVTIPANTTYRLTLLPTTATNVVFYNFTVNNNALLANFPGGITWYYTYRQNAGAFSDTNTKRPWMGLQVSGVDVSAGGGGASAHGFA